MKLDMKKIVLILTLSEKSAFYVISKDKLLRSIPVLCLHFQIITRIKDLEKYINHFCLNYLAI